MVVQMFAQRWHRRRNQSNSSGAGAVLSACSSLIKADELSRLVALHAQANDMDMAILLGGQIMVEGSPSQVILTAILWRTQWDRNDWK